jgi:hypothetical protein
MPEISGDQLTFLNRDHIICVVVHEAEIVVTTTPGTQVIIPVSGAMLERFTDELANHIHSNFVAIAARPRVVSYRS